MKTDKSFYTDLRRHRQSGFSLIEMMIAIAIAAFLSLVLVVVFINMKDAFNAQDQLSQLQDNERLALTILTNAVQSAGYFPDPTVSTVENDLPAVGGSLAAGQGISGTSGVAPLSDTLTTRYASASGDGLMDCLGQTNTSGNNTIITNIFSVSASKELMCSIDGGATTTALVSNVSALSVLYGVDTTSSGSVDRYLTASAVTADLWTNVKAVRITITFLNPFAGQTGQATITWVQSINLMNKT